MDEDAEGVRAMKASYSAGVLIGLGLLALPAVSLADSVTYVQTSDHCTFPTGGIGACTIDTNNKVTISTTNVANQLLITATLDTGWYFIKTGAGGGLAL